MTHDYIRYATHHLLCRSISTTAPRSTSAGAHRHQEFIRFFNGSSRHARRQPIHAILDNYAIIRAQASESAP
jgi:hypothetical protein